MTALGKAKVLRREQRAFPPKLTKKHGGDDSTGKAKALRALKTPKDGADKAKRTPG